MSSVAMLCSSAPSTSYRAAGRPSSSHCHTPFLPVRQLSSSPSGRSASQHRGHSVCSKTIVCSAASIHAFPSSSLTRQQHEETQQVQQQQPAINNPVTIFVQAVFQLVQKVTEVTRNAVAGKFPKFDAATALELHKQLQVVKLGVRMMAVIMPLARAAGTDNLSQVYARTFERAAFGFAKMYVFCMFMRVLLSWFPEIDWNAQPWTFLRLITEPYLQIYRGILPPLFGQLDFTPLFGFLILQDVVEIMAPTYTMGLHKVDTSTRWTTSDAMCYFDGF